MTCPAFFAEQVLEQVYIDDRNIDEPLVDSIVQPAQDPNAAEVFYRIITGKGTPVNQLLARLDKPLLLLWGAQDPWCGPPAFFFPGLSLHAGAQPAPRTAGAVAAR